MKKIILAIASILLSASAFAQRGAVQGHSYIGGTKATVSGLNSSNYMNGIIPAATVTVYLTGTTTKASIYSDAGGTVLSNPFTSNIASSVDPGGWIFFAATNQGLDVVMSGGNGNPSCNTAPLCYVNPVTLVDVFPTQSFSPVSGLASATSTLPIQVNGGTGPVTSGNVLISCANNCAAYGQLLMQINPPAPAAQQYILYPTSVSGTGTTSNTVQCGGLTAGAASCSGSGTLANGGYISHPYCNLNCSTNNIITWSFPSLPSFINPANVTSIYGGMVGYTTTTTLVGNGTTFQYECGKTSQTTVVTTQAYGTPLAFGTYTALLSGLVGTDVPSITCDAQMLAADPVQAGMFGNMPSTFLVIDYTGSAPPTNTAITVIPPLNFNPGNNSLSLAVPFDVGIDTGAANAYAVSLPWTAQRQPGTTVKFLPVHASTSTTPTFNLNGIGAATIVGPQGGALVSGDLNTTTTAVVILDNAGNWRLQDPQISAGGSVTWPASADIVLSNGTNSPAGLAPVNGDCVVGAGGAWTAGSCGSGTGAPGTPAGTMQVYKTNTTFGGTQNWVFEAGVNGAACDDTTDDTSAFNTLLSTVNTAGGGIITVYGTCLFSGQITLPNSGGSTATQSTIRITGGGNSGDASPSPAFHGPSVMDLRFNASNAKILTLGLGRFELDHLTLKDGGSDCAAFIMTTSTIVSIHDVQFTGTATGTSACNDAIILGGTTTTYATNSTTAAFEGYGSSIDKNTFDNIRRGVWLKVFAQAVPVTNNTWHATCGSASTAAALEVGYAVAGSAVGTTDGNTFSGNYFETTNYPYVVWVHGSFNQFKNEDFWDASGTTLFAYHFTDRGLTAGLNTAMIGADSTFSIGTNLSDANAPGSSNSVSEQVIQASMGLAAIQNRICNDTSGSGTAQTCNTGIPFTPAAGSLILYHTTTNNSGTGLTINVNSLGAKSVAKWQKITTLASGDVQSGTYIPMVYDGINWVMQAPGNSPSGSGLSGMTSGQVPIAATATTVTSSKAIQGTDTNLLSSGTILGTGVTLCTDANGGATTSGCSAGSTGALINITGSGQITATGCAQSASTGGYCSISGTTTTAVTFSVIPGSYLGLHTVIWGQGSATLNVQTTFNSDTGSHYSLVGYFQSGASGPGANSAATQAFCAGSGLTTGNVSAIISDVPFYADTSFAKVIETHAGEMASTGTSSSNFDLGTSCSWDNGGTPAAITSITYTASTGHFVAGTKFIIYGVN